MNMIYESSKDDGEDTEVDTNRESDAFSESGDYKGIDNYVPDLGEALPPEERKHPNSIVIDLYNKLEVENNYY